MKSLHRNFVDMMRIDHLKSEKLMQRRTNGALEWNRISGFGIDGRFHL